MIKDTSSQDVVSTKKPARFKLWQLLVPLVLVGGYGLYSMISANGDASKSFERQRLTMATVTKGVFVKDIAANGKVVAAVSPTMYASASGTVTLQVNAGQTVEQGQVLAIIDSPELLSELAQEQATLQSLRSDISRLKIDQKKAALEYQQKIEVFELELEAAKREMKRAERSLESLVISDLDYQKAKDTLKRAKVDFRHIRQQAGLADETVSLSLETKLLEQQRQSLIVQDLERKVAALEVKASVSGVISVLSVEQKANVQKNDPLMTVVDLSELEVELKVPEMYADELDLGLLVEVNFKNTIVKGELIAISPEVEANQVVARVRFVESVPSSLRQNQRLTARVVVLEKEETLKIKRGGFLENGGFTVYVVQDNLAKRRRVSLGAKSSAEVEIISGLEAGETIVISNTNLFKNDETVILR